MIKMKKYLLVLLLSGLLIPVSVDAQKSSRKKQAVEEPKLIQNEIDSVSYAFGILIGMNMKDVGFSNFNYELFTRALKDVLTNQPNFFNDELSREIVNSYVANLMNKETEENLSKSEEFLAINSKEEGIITLESGLQYRVLEEGTGPLPGPESKVMVHYTGMLTDGTVFDSSYEAGDPVEIPLNMVIKGWTEALQLMPVGSHWIIYLPPHLGYGEMSPPGSPIKSNSVLIFEIKLFSIVE
jgi:FKBP-type peptidyl-prolyl cis-trans isomerase